MIAQPPAVEMRGIVKRFGPVVANQGVDLSVDAGEVLALLGENGAGKSTLMKILYGLYQPDAGEIRLHGRTVAFRQPADAIAHGIGMVSQHFSLVPAFTVAENLVLGKAGAGALVNRAAAEADVRAVAALCGMDLTPSARVGDLSVGEQQRVEILKALYRQARVLILDEPTAVLAPRETAELFGILKRLVGQGMSVVFISHKLEEVLALANRVMVLRDGRNVGQAPVAEADASTLARMMVGRATFHGSRLDFVPLTGSPGMSDTPPALELREVKALNARQLPALNGVSLRVHPGEIVGIAGVAGNGQRELAEVITGMRRVQGGEIRLDGRPITNFDAAQTIAAGIGRIPEDRHAGVVGDLTVAENLVIEHLDDFIRHGRLDRARVRQHAQELIHTYNIKAQPDSIAGKLSGGNIQKMILARTLCRNPRLVVASQPTRGLDIGATKYVQGTLLDQRSRGAAVLLISEDLDEIIALSDRIAVMFNGRIAGVVPAASARPEQLGLMMAGGRGGKEDG